MNRKHDKIEGLPKKEYPLKDLFPRTVPAEAFSRVHDPQLKRYLNLDYEDFQALETELEQSDEQVQMQLIELQKLKEFVRHKKDCPDDEEGSFGCCTCGLDELLNQSEG